MIDCFNKYNRLSTPTKPIWWCCTDKPIAFWRSLFRIVLVSNELRRLPGRCLGWVFDIILLRYSPRYRFILTEFCQIIWLFSKEQLDKTILNIFRFSSLFICRVVSINETSLSCCSEYWHLHTLLYFSEIISYLKATCQPTCVVSCRRMAYRTADYSPF